MACRTQTDNYTLNIYLGQKLIRYNHFRFPWFMHSLDVRSHCMCRCGCWAMPAKRVCQSLHSKKTSSRTALWNTVGRKFEKKKGRCPDTSFRIDIFCVSKLFAYKTCQKEFSHQIQTKAFKKETRGKEVLPSKIKFTVTYCGFFYPLLCFLIYTPSFLANQCLLSGLLECRIHLHCRYITLHF